MIDSDDKRMKQNGTTFF